MAARLLFEGLWCMADREGRLEDRPLRIKAEILPYDDVDVDDLLDQLQARKFIIRYLSGEDGFIQVVNFKKHQSPHLKEAESLIPSLPSTPVACCISQSDTVPESVSPLPDLDIAGDMQHGGTVQAPDLHQASRAESLNLNPDTGIRTAETNTAPAARLRAVDLLFESVVDACYAKAHTEISDSERSRVNKALVELRKLHATPMDVYQRAKEYRKRSPDMPFTPQTLTKCWTDLATRREPTRASPTARNRPDYSGIDDFSRQMDALEARGRQA